MSLVSINSKERTVACPVTVGVGDVVLVVGPEVMATTCILRIMKGIWELSVEEAINIIMFRGVRADIVDPRVRYSDEPSVGEVNIVYYGESIKKEAAPNWQFGTPTAIVFIASDVEALATPWHGVFTTRVAPNDIEGQTEGQIALLQTDRDALRELERRLIGHTPIGQQREALRDATPVEEINVDRAVSISAGFYWAAKDATFDSDMGSLSLVTGRVAKIQALNLLSRSAPDFYWRALDNTDHLFTPNEFLSFAIAMDDWIESKYVESWAAKAAL